MKIQWAVSAFAVLLAATPGAWAQGNAARADAPMKVGVINMQTAIAGTAEGKQEMAQLQAQFAPRQTEIANLGKQLQDIQTKLQAEANTASDDEKADLQSQYQNLNRTAQRKEQDLQDDAQQAQQDMINRIGRKMMDVLNKYAAQNGYAMILDNDQTTQTIPIVLFHNDQTDVTQDIVRLYDQTYPLKAAAAPAKPAPRPAPKQ